MKKSRLTPRRCNVLIACEESQAEMMAFLDRGFNVYSCDIQKARYRADQYRSRTFPQVAAAIAKQWGDYVLQNP